MDRDQRATLQLDEHIAFQHAFWRFQRIAWIAMAIVLLAAILGAFGSGVLGRTSATSSEARMRVEYERFLRMDAPSTWSIHVHGGTRGESVLRLRLTGDYPEKIQIEDISPRPTHVEAAGAEGRVFAFSVAQTPERPAALRFRFRPQSWGALEGTMTTGDSASVRIRQFVYP